MASLDPKARSTALSRTLHAMLLGSALLAGAGCRSWDDFTALEGAAPVTHPRVHTEGPRFGAVLVGYETPLRRDDRFVRATRLYVGGSSLAAEGIASYGVFRIWDEQASGHEIVTVLEPDRADARTLPPGMLGCNAADQAPDSTLANCGSGRRTAAAFPVLHLADEAWYGCIAVSTGVFRTTERIFLRCESAGPRTLALNLESSLGWGASAVGVPFDSSFGVAVFGAPSTDDHGALFRVQHARELLPASLGAPDAAGVRTGAIQIEGLTLTDGASFGRSLALTSVGADRRIRIAAALGEGEASRVAVIDVVSWDATRADAHVVGCLAGGPDDMGFGDALAFGDFDGDGLPELAVGAQPVSPTAAPLERPVAIFDGRGFGADVPCGLDATPSAEPVAMFGCQAASVGGQLVECGASRFGHALAAGDFDGDGLDDLAVGAPGARTSHAGAGVVQTIAGRARLADMGREGSPRGSVLLTDSGDSAGFGSSVAAIPAPFGRADLAASQSAPASVHIFYCSNLAGDDPSSLAAADAGAGTRIVRSCGLAPGSSTSSQLDPRILGGGASPDAGVPDASAPIDAGRDVDAWLAGDVDAARP